MYLYNNIFLEVYDFGCDTKHECKSHGGLIMMDDDTLILRLEMVCVEHLFDKCNEV